jgi:uncharacterized membrane protein YdjX (TVP38/TMEM64 family)
MCKALLCLFTKSGAKLVSCQKIETNALFCPIQPFRDVFYSIISINRRNNKKSAVLCIWMKKQDIGSLLLGLWFTAGPLVVGTLISAYIIEQNDLYNYPPLALAGVAILAVVLLGLALIPTTLVALLGGFLFGMPSLLFTVATYLPAVFVGYTLAKHFRPTWLQAWLAKKPRFAGFVQNLRGGGWQTVFWLRIHPAFPFSIGNLSLAWAGIPLRAVMLGSLPGMLPRTILTTYFGQEAHSLYRALMGGHRPYGNLLLIFLFASMATVALRYLGKQAPKEMEPQ